MTIFDFTIWEIVLAGYLVSFVFLAWFQSRVIKWQRRLIDSLRGEDE